jgi:dTDP-4-amino-4,6-dideoxygalactose transaminase
VGVGPGDEVITTPLTFGATANVIVHQGARPVFVDVDPRTGNMDPGRIEKAITRRTKALLPVHLYGHPCPMDDLMAIARGHGLFVVEDAAHSTEAWYRGRKIGTIGDITVFSFYVTKNLVTGDGGMLVTDNETWAQDIRIKRLHGLSRDAWKRYSEEGFQSYEVVTPGYKYNMMDIQAALGIHQLARLEENLRIREKHWKRYNEAFEDVDEIAIPSEILNEPGYGLTRHARHLYTVLVDVDRLGISRLEFMNVMKSENIGTGIHFIALHLHAFYGKHLGYKRGDFPNAEFISDRTMSLPLSSRLREEDYRDVIKAVRKIVSHSATGHVKCRRNRYTRSAQMV